MERISRSIGTSIALSLLIGLPQACYAGQGAQDLATFIETHIINQAIVAFVGIAAAAIFYYAARLLLNAYNEQSQGEMGTAFLYVLIGFFVIGLSKVFVTAFKGQQNPTTINPNAVNSLINNAENPDALIPGLASVINFLIEGAAGAFILMAVIAGLHMITSNGDQGTFDKWKQVLINRCFGVMIMMLAYFLANGIFAPNHPGILLEEMTGLILFLLTIIGTVSAIALIVAGIFLIVSIDESLRDRAKTTIIGTLISLAITMASYTIIITLL